jgi:hypothetical protein
MKMARASEADIEASLEILRHLEALERGFMPEVGDGDEIEWFAPEDPDDCQRALRAILDASAKGSIFRVVFGMAVVLDPRNELLDPGADTIEMHPKIVKALTAMETSNAHQTGE